MKILSLWETLPTDIKSLIFSFDPTYKSMMPPILGEIERWTSRMLAGIYLQNGPTVDVSRDSFRYLENGMSRIVHFTQCYDGRYHLVDYNTLRGTFCVTML